MLKQSAVALGLTTLLAGCQLTGPSAVCTPDTIVNIPEAEVPAKSSDDVKVIVLPVDLEFEDSAKDRLQSIVRNALETHVTETGTQLVDRKLANKLKKEIKLAEQSGRYNAKGVPIADYAIITEITSSDLSYKHTEAHTATNLLTGEDMFVPARCDFDVDFTAVAKVVTLPDMTLVKRIELKGDESLQTDTKRTDCPISKATYQGLASKAAAEAVDYNAELRTLLAARAPIVELRQCEAGSMVKIAMGSEKNVAPNAKVAFSKVMKNSEGELETFAAGEGTVVNIPEHGIKAKYSWVSIDEETALKVQKGDAARIVPTACKSIIDFECQTQDLMKGL